MSDYGDGDPPPPSDNPAPPTSEDDAPPPLVSDDDDDEFSVSESEEVDDDGWDEDVDDELDEMEEQALMDEAWMGAPGVPGMMQAFLGLGGGGDGDGDPDVEDDDPWGWNDDGMDAEFFWDEGEWDSDGELSDASTVEPEDEAAATDRAAETTAGRHLITPPAAYALPSATFHFQSADALATAPDPARPGATLVATMDSDGVLLFSMPSAGAMRRLGGPPVPMRFLGGFESPALSAYSLQLSPDGRLLAAGGDEGSLEIYFVDAGAPQRPPVPAATIDDMATHQPFFYLPIIPPDSDWAAGERPARVAREIHELLTATDDGAAAAEAAAGHIPRGYPRTYNDAEFLHILGFRDTAFLAPPSADAIVPPERPHGSAPIRRPGLGWVPSDPFFAAAVEDQTRGLEHQFREFAANVVGGRAKIDWVLGEGAAEEEGGEAQATEEGAAADEAGPSTRRTTRSGSAATKKKPPPKKPPLKQQKKAAKGAEPDVPPAIRGAVSLGALLVLGFPTVEEARNNTMNQEGMVNGVRFGLVAGRQRLVAAEQSGRIYVFDTPEVTPDIAAPGADLPAAMMCASLGDPSPHWSLSPVVAFPADPTPLGASLRRRGTVLSTAALGPFDVPINLAVPSPNGRWIAAVGDQKSVILLDQADGFAPRELPFDVLRHDPDFLAPANEAGAQYAAWNASSTALAVTSDALHAVFVYDIPSGQMVMRVEGFVRAVLPCLWAPWDDSVLLFAEESKMLHARTLPPEARGGGVPCIDANAREDLAEPGSGSQLVRLRENPRRPRGGRRRVTGMGIAAEGDVLVATKQGTAYRFLSATEWSPETHAGWPAPFKTAVRQVLLGAGRDGCPLADLPQAMVMRVVTALAGSRLDWFEVVEANEAAQEGGDAAVVEAAAAGAEEPAPAEPPADEPGEGEGGGG